MLGCCALAVLATDGHSARHWRLRAPASALQAPSYQQSYRQWHIYTARFLSSTTCDESSALSTPTAVATASGFVCNSSPMLCNMFPVNKPSNALTNQAPGLEMCAPSSQIFAPVIFSCSSPSHACCHSHLQGKHAQRLERAGRHHALHGRDRSSQRGLRRLDCDRPRRIDFRRVHSTLPSRQDRLEHQSRGRQHRRSLGDSPKHMACTT